MKFRAALLASAVGLLFAAPAEGADPMIAADAKAFGTRPSAEAVDISPNGQRLLMIDPGPGKSSILTIVDVATGQQKAILKSSADSIGASSRPTLSSSANMAEALTSTRP